MKTVFISCILLLSITTGGCVHLSVGISGHSKGSDEPEYTGNSPLGIVRIETTQVGKVRMFCEHISSIPDVEMGWGLNHCGGVITLN